jgi:hypothetical protein
LLLTGNFLDTNVMVHRRDLVARFGGWDTDLVRMVDWDIALRFTVEKPARPLAVLAAQYRQCDDQSITLAIPRWPAEVAVRAKWFPPPAPTLRPRVLYVVWHYPQLSESYAETELACMRRWGVHVEVWCTSAGASLYPTDVTIHRGSLAVAIEAARPDIIHVHWLGFANMQRDELAAAGLPFARQGSATGGADGGGAAIQGPRMLFRGGANVAGLSFRAGGGHLSGCRGVCGRAAHHT